MTDEPETSTGPSLRFEGLVRQAWNERKDGPSIEWIRDISASVSTNRVFMVGLSDGHELVAKTTCYGSYVHFRQDHRIVMQWRRRMAATRYRDFLAPVLSDEEGDAFTRKLGGVWITFYQKAPFYDFLPPVLSNDQVACLGSEMAHFHQASRRAAPQLLSSWKSMGSDVATLFDLVDSASFCEERNFPKNAGPILQAQCDQFLTNAEKLGYQSFKKIPVLVDWNIGNFSVGLLEDGFRFYSRWDYDWLRVEPRTLDFYFCARVVRAEGDQDTFSYNVAPFFDERFVQFLRAYHHVAPLEDEEVLFLKEAYRFFLLNYVIRIGEHFFRRSICRRLQQEAFDNYFPTLQSTSFAPLLKAIG